MKRAAALLCAGLVVPSQAVAGAWVLKQGEFQFISSAISSDAALAFDDSGSASRHIVFDKVLATTWSEYGLTNRITVFVAPEVAYARLSLPSGKIVSTQDHALAAGFRWRAADLGGPLSLQASYKTAGAFDMSTAASLDDRGSEIELRLLYGANFKLLHRDGFINLEAAQRWIAGARPNETPLDLSLGWHVSPRATVVLDSFNIISAGDARPPFGYYRTHKIQADFIWQSSRHFSVQSGLFFSPAGQNSLAERGIAVGLWVRF